MLSDHQPQGKAEKDIAFVGAQFGAIALQTVWPLLLQAASEADLSPLQTVCALTSGPAKVLGWPGNELSGGELAAVRGIQLGADADLTLADTTTNWLLEGAEVASKSHASWFMNRDLKGLISATIRRGKLTFERPGHCD